VIPSWGHFGHNRGSGENSGTANYRKRLVGRDGIDPPTPDGDLKLHQFIAEEKPMLGSSRPALDESVIRA